MVIDIIGFAPRIIDIIIEPFLCIIVSQHYKYFILYYIGEIFMRLVITAETDMKKVIEYLITQENENFRILKHSNSSSIPQTLWTVIQSKEDGFNFICCDILRKQRTGTWAYTSIAEANHPPYYNCPISFLKLAPTIRCHEWREKVLQKTNQRKMKVKVGDILMLSNCTITWVVVSKIINGTVFGVDEDGIEHRVPPRYWNSVYESDVKLDIPIGVGIKKLEYRSIANELGLDIDGIDLSQLDLDSIDLDDDDVDADTDKNT